MRDGDGRLFGVGFARDECEFDGRTRVDGSVPSFQMQVLCTLVTGDFHSSMDG